MEFSLWNANEALPNLILRNILFIPHSVVVIMIMGIYRALSAAQSAVQFHEGVEHVKKKSNTQREKNQWHKNTL